MLGEKIKHLRKANGLSQEQLAAKLNVSRQAISKWEMGAIPDIDNIVKISNFFDCSLDYLMNNDVNYMDCTNETKTINAVQTQNKKLTTKFVLRIIALLPVLLLSIVWLVSKAVSFPISRQDPVSGNFYTGFTGFVVHFHLSTLVYGCVAVWVASVVAIAIQQIYVQSIKKSKEFICCFLVHFALIAAGTILWMHGFLNPWKFYWTMQTAIFVSIYFAALLGTSIAMNYFANE